MANLCHKKRKRYLMFKCYHLFLLPYYVQYVIFILREKYINVHIVTCSGRTKTRFRKRISVVQNAIHSVRNGNVRIQENDFQRDHP